MLLLHGWGTSPDRLEPMRSALVAAGLRAAHHVYEPHGSIRALGATLADEVGDDPVHLVGHSLGGLVAASGVLDHGLPARSVTTVNTPWRGTWVAWTAQSDDPLGVELRWRSDELARLRGLLGAHLDGAAGPHWTLLSALGDVAAPATTALRTPGGTRLARRVVAVAGHSVSLYAPRMVDTVVDLLAPAPAV